ncbi:MAG: hypothetical protein RR351_03420, partial [Christensenella sp.]
MSEEHVKIDPNSRDYSLEGFEEDERFIVCRKECILSVIMYFVMAGGILLAMYTIGAGDAHCGGVLAGLA